jgi:YVTN family beta-propeller protein
MSLCPSSRRAAGFAVLCGAALLTSSPARAQESLPTGARITPTAAEGALFQPLNPGLPGKPDFTAGQAVTTATSPDGATLLILTSGYNRNNGPDGRRVAAQSLEYVFVYDISVNPPVRRQVLMVPNTFGGLAWNPSGAEFYVSGGGDDKVHVFARAADGTWAEAATIALGHALGLGLGVPPMAAGIGVSPSGHRAVVANFENDSATVLDLVSRSVVAEVGLRPGGGHAGGEYPYWVAFDGEDKAFVSSERDDEVVVLSLAATPAVSARIATGHQPNRMLVDHARGRLYVANGGSDTVAVVEIATGKVLEQISVTALAGGFFNPRGLKGANPNSLALSRDGQTLYVTAGGINAVAVIQLPSVRDDDGDRNDDDRRHSRLVGLIPTGWYPNSVSLNADGTRLHVVNGKSSAGPNPGACRDTDSIAPGSSAPCSARNLYVWQLTKAGYLTLPVPSRARLAALTLQVAVNNHFVSSEAAANSEAVMAFLRGRIKHVVYIVKENRTYDQVLGDLEVGNGDPSLNVFPEPITPNFHAFARRFVTLDNFFDSGEVSGDGWNWTTAARTTDFTEKTVPINYAGRGLTYDWEGTNRNINVAHATVADRKAANPLNPDDPDLLPGTVDAAAPAAAGNEGGTSYLWDAALRKGLTVRNYGFYGDGLRYAIPGNPAYVPIVRNPFEQKIVQFFPAKPSLLDVSDPYFRTFDMSNADFWLFKEWEREFDQFARDGNLPALELLRLPHDHFGSFDTAIDGVNTPDTQIADNDYAVGLVADKISHSRFRDDTLIFVIEDDAQNGGDHVDAHRSIGFVVGAFVRQGAVVSKRFNTVSMVRTIGEVLGLERLGLTDGFAAPMAEVFEPRLRPRPWTFDALVPEVLRTTALPVPPRTAHNTVPATRNGIDYSQPRGTAAQWAQAMANQSFSRADDLDEGSFNLALWRGLMGDRPFPTERDGRDLSQNRKRLLRSAAGR